MKVLVTGANGFVGSNLCANLIAAGDQVTALVRPAARTGFIDGLARLRVMTGDITDPTSLGAPMAGAEIVYHVAAHVGDWGPMAVFRKVNVAGVGHVMTAAREAGVRRVVHISSVSVYGFPGGVGICEDAPFIARPGDPYVTTKAEGERLALSFHGRGLEVAVIRPSGIHGPNDHTTTAPMAVAMEAGKFGFVDGGRHIMSALYIDNLCQLIRLAGVHPEAAGEAFNAADDGIVTWRQYSDWMCAELGCPVPRLSLPRQMAWPLAVMVEGAAKLARARNSPPINKYRIRAVMADAHYSTTKAKQRLGYAPRVSTRDGITRAVAWYRGLRATKRAAA